MIISTISRQDRKDAYNKEVEAQHTQWVLFIQEKMRSGKTAKQGYSDLCKAVVEEEKAVPPQCRKQFREAWAVFQEKVKKAQQ